MRWNDLSMKDKSELIKLGVQSGLYDIESIKEVYNKYADGGELQTPDSGPQSAFDRKRSNDSRTKEESEDIENDIAKRQRGRIKYEKSRKINSDKYYIPYIIENEIKIPKVGRTSSNFLDSIYVNAQRAGIPFKEGLGLASVETKFGAVPNLSTKAWKVRFKKDNGREPTKEEVRQHENRVLNSSFARNFGGIYPQFLINDHEWTDRGWEESAKYRDKLKDIKSPLEHGFTLYKMGLYNRGMSNHTNEVKSEGERLINTPIVQQWLRENESKYKK